MSQVQDVEQLISDALGLSHRLGLVQPDSVARNIRRALQLEGFIIVPDAGWQYACRTSTGGIVEHMAGVDYSEHVRCTRVRRHPATEWEVDPDV